MTRRAGIVPQINTSSNTFNFININRPVVYKQYGKFDASVVKKLAGGSFDNVIRYHVWEQEVAAQLCVAQSHKLECIVETVTGVIDVKDMKLSQITNDFLTLTKLLAEIDQKQYPETLGRIFIINVPSVFPFVWRMVKPWLDPATAAKIEIYAGPKEYEPALKNFIGEDNLPSNYGGKLAALSSEVHPYATFMSLKNSFLNINDLTPSRSIDESQNYSARLQPMESFKLTSFYSVQEGSPNVSRVGKDSHVRHSVDKRPVSTTIDRHATSTNESSQSYFAYFSNIIAGVFQYPHIENEEREEISMIEEKDDDKDEIDMDEEKSCSTDSNMLFSDALEFTTEDELRRIQSAYSTPNHHSINRRSYKNWKDELAFLSTIYSLNGSEVHSAEGNSSAIMKPFRYVLEFFKYVLHKITLDNWLSNTSTSRLELYLIVSVAVYFLTAIMAMILSAIELFTTPWVSPIARLQLWAGMIVLLVSTMMIIFTSVGYVGIRLKNRPLLIFFTSFLAFGTFGFFVVFLVCILYYCLPEFAAWENHTIDSTVSNSAEQQEAVNLVKQYDLSLAIGTIMATLLGTVVFIWALALIKRYQQEAFDKSHSIKLREMQVVMKVAQVVSVLSALVMLAYGISCLSFLSAINYMHCLFDVYGLILGGVAVLLSAFIGIWSSATIHRSVLRVYYTVIVPLVIALLFSISCLAFADLGNSSHFVSLSYESMTTSLDLDSIQLKIQTQLLVTGILTLFICIFEITSIIASWHLLRLVDLLEIENEEHSILKSLREKELGIYGQNHGQTSLSPFSKDPFWADYSAKLLGRLYLRNVRGNKDRFVMLWATIFGLWNIFVSGTFVVMSFVGVNAKHEWEFGVWRFIGRSDSRILDSDPYLMSTDVLNALVLGPLLLFFAWATFVFAPYRHVCGIIVCSIHIYSWFVYYLMEMQSSFVDMNSVTPAITTLYVLFSFVIWMALPFYVLVREAKSAAWDTNMHDSNKMSSEVEEEKYDDFQVVKEKSKQLRRRRRKSDTRDTSQESIDILRMYSIKSDIESGVNIDIGRAYRGDVTEHSEQEPSVQSAPRLLRRNTSNFSCNDSGTATSSLVINKEGVEKGESIFVIGNNLDELTSSSIMTTKLSIRDTELQTWGEFAASSPTTVNSAGQEAAALSTHAETKVDENQSTGRERSLKRKLSNTGSVMTI